MLAAEAPTVRARLVRSNARRNPVRGWRGNAQYSHARIRYQGRNRMRARLNWIVGFIGAGGSRAAFRRECEPRPTGSDPAEAADREKTGSDPPFSPLRPAGRA